MSLVYFAPGVKVPGPATDIAVFARLMTAGPWKAKSAIHPELGQGALAWNGPEEFTEDLLKGEWRECHDGLRYRRPPVMPTQASLARSSCPRGIDVLMSTGVQLTIPLALAAPRKLSFARQTTDEPATEFGRIAHKLGERLRALPENGGIPNTDPEVLHTVTQALMTAYRVTPELLDDLEWITSADLEPIVCAIMGSDPKAFAPEPSTSPSPVAVSGTSP